MNADIAATVEGWPAEQREHLGAHPELLPYVEAGDEGTEAAQRRYDADAIEARRSLKAAGVQVYRTVTVRGMQTTALEMEPNS